MSILDCSYASNLFHFVTITLTTPALLFPAISLLLLAYTNRFNALAALIRKLHADYQVDMTNNILAQLQNLQLRIHLIRAMQLTGVLSLLFCTVSMSCIYIDQPYAGAVLFGISLVAMVVSLFFSIWEIHISAGALTILLQDLRRKSIEQK